jgi:peptidoglycan/xylan/chitin deacetylase (PgdA/CDA1 family)
VPVLMYHVVERAPAGTPSPGLWVPREEFKSEVDTLASRGYHGVTLKQVWDAWHHGGLLPSKPVVFSFDDGYASQYTNARPILRSHGWSGVLNLEVATLHTTLRPWQVRGLIRSGWEIDAHTMTHPDLTKTYGAQLKYEVVESRRWIRSHFGVPVNFFCYPAGRFDAHVVAAVKAAGYLGATTTNAGFADPSRPPYELQRVRVNSGDGAAGLLRDLQAAGSGATSGKSAGE